MGRAFVWYCSQQCVCVGNVFVQWSLGGCFPIQAGWVYKGPDQFFSHINWMIAAVSQSNAIKAASPLLSSSFHRHCNWFIVRSLSKWGKEDKEGKGGHPPPKKVFFHFSSKVFPKPSRETAVFPYHCYLQTLFTVTCWTCQKGGQIPHKEEAASLNGDSRLWATVMKLSWGYNVIVI